MAAGDKITVCIRWVTRLRWHVQRDVAHGPQIFPSPGLSNVLLALKCRSFDTPIRGVFKPGYSGSGCSDVHGSIPIRIHDHAAA